MKSNHLRQRTRMANQPRPQPRPDIMTRFGNQVIDAQVVRDADKAREALDAQKGQP